MRLQRGLDHILIFTGYGDFRSLVSALQELGKRVSIVCTLATNPADEEAEVAPNTPTPLPAPVVGWCPSKFPTALRENKRADGLQKKLLTALVAVAWLIYLGTTAYAVWRILSGDTPSFLKNYTLGTNAGWVMIGVMLWVVTEWFRGLGNDPK